MRVATGPGKIRQGLKSPSRGAFFGLLYNFDIDDSSVKPEHQQWLETNVLPVLLKSKETTIHLKGTASRSGSKAYNEALSKRRVDAIRNYLLSKGIAAGRIQISWVGELEAELRGTKDNTESEEDRAVAVLVKRNSIGMPTWARIDTTNRLDGFDSTTTPAWLMVPARPGNRKLRLLNGGGLKLRSSKPAVLLLVDPVTNQPTAEILVAGNDAIVEFVGGVPGNAGVLAIDVDGRTDAVLSVDVLAKKTASVGFYYVEDNAKHKTTRKVGDEKSIMTQINAVFNQQANVFFTTRVATTLKVNKDWGATASYATLGGTDLPELRKHGDATLRVRVFAVWDYDAKPGSGDTDAEVDAIGGVCVIWEDNAGKDLGLTMAHEFGHNLALEHREITKDNLMWPYTDQRTGLLQRDQILLLNRKV